MNRRSNESFSQFSDGDPSAKGLNVDTWGAKPPLNLNRRDFLKATSVGLASTMLISCAPEVVSAIQPTAVAIESPVPTETALKRPEVVLSALTAEKMKMLEAEYNAKTVSGYDKFSGKLRSLTADEKPTLKTAYSIGERQIIVGYGINGEVSYITKFSDAKGEKWVKLDSVQMTDASGNQYEMFEVYDNYTTQGFDLADRNLNTSLGLPVLAFKLEKGQYSGLLSFEPTTGGYQNSHDGFATVVDKKTKGKMLSLLSMDTANDVVTATKLMSNYVGDWKIVFEGGVEFVVDVKSKEKLMKYVTAKKEWDVAGEGITMFEPGSDPKKLMEILNDPFNMVSVEYLIKKYGYDPKKPSAAPFNAWALENAKPWPEGTPVAEALYVTELKNGIEIFTPDYSEKMVEATDVPAQYYVQTIDMSQTQLYPDALGPEYKTALVVTMLTPTTEGNIATSMIFSGLSEVQMKDLLNQIGEDRNNLLTPMFFMNNFSSILDDKMPKAMIKQVTGPVWTDPVTKKTGSRTIYDEMIEMERYFAQNQPGEGKITKAKLPAIQDVLDKTFLQGYPANDAGGSNGPTK